MAHIKVVAKPTGASERYQYFVNEETGQQWKALLELQNARASFITQADVETAPAQLAITVTVSPVDNVGKALRDEAERPIVIDSWTHTFTSTELEEPNFDPQVRIANMIAERIHIGEAQVSGNAKLKQLADSWGGKAKLKLPTVTFERTIENGEG